MKKQHSILALFSLLLFFGNISAQEIIRTDFLQIGDTPIEKNLSYSTVSPNGQTGYTMTSVYSSVMDEDVKAEIKAQKKQGFKAVDKATMLFGIMRTLDSPYSVEAGMTYRIIAFTPKDKEVFSLRAVTEDGSLAVPEVQVSGGNYGNAKVQLNDYTPTKNGTIRIQNGTMSMDSNKYTSVRYLIFKKKMK